MTYDLRPHPEYGFFQVSPTPTDEEISAYYADEFYSGDYRRLNDSSLEIQLADQDFYNANRADICRQVEGIVGSPVAGRTVLDIGCGWGQALLFFREQGMQCFGFDPAPEAVEYARSQGLEVIEAGVTDMRVFGEQRFDVVTLLNVLEHLADPIGAVDDILRNVLAPNGVLVVDVPNEFNAFQRAGRDLHGLSDWWVAPPAHLNYFSATTLRRMLEGVGYSVPLIKSSFPIEMFLLFGRDYVSSPELGRHCHEERMAFEANLRRFGEDALLHDLYVFFAEHDLGRQVVAYGQSLSR